MTILAKIHLMAITAGAWITSGHNGMVVAKITGMHSLIFKISFLMTVGTKESFVTFKTIILVLFGNSLMSVYPV